MLSFLIALSMLSGVAQAKSSRTVKLADGEMEQIFVEPGFSTLLKFTSRPEPGLIGDQDGFKVEYMKNIVAIKPLVARGKTNLFIFTKEGQFNFQLVAGRGNHDNVVYVETQTARIIAKIPQTTPIAVEELAGRKINKAVAKNGFRLRLESLAQPRSRATMVLKFAVEQILPAKAESCSDTAPEVDSHCLSLVQDGKPVAIENMILERKLDSQCVKTASGYILIRGSQFNREKPMKLILTAKYTDGKPKPPIELSFIPEVRR